MNTQLTLVKTASFGNISCDFYQLGEKFFMTREQIATALDYGSGTSIQVMHLKNKDRLDSYSVPYKLYATDGKSYKTVIIYSAKGVYEICRISVKPKAHQFYDFVYEMFERLIEEGLQLVLVERKPTTNRLEFLQAELDEMKAQLNVLEQQGQVSVQQRQIFDLQESEIVALGNHLYSLENHAVGHSFVKGLAPRPVPLPSFLTVPPIPTLKPDELDVFEWVANEMDMTPEQMLQFLEKDGILEENGPYSNYVVPTDNPIDGPLRLSDKLADTLKKQEH